MALAAQSLLASAGFGSHPYTRQLDAVWRPAAAFAGVCAALAVLTYGLVGHRLGHDILTRHTAVNLTVVLLVDVLLVTGVLTLASNDTGRTLALGAGGICALIGAAFLLGGAPIGIGASVLCLMIVGIGARESVHHVEDGAVHVTELPGGRHRTLSPGLNLLLPGERVLAMLSTRPCTYQTLPESARLPNGMEAEAAVTIQYALLAEHAGRAVATTRDWERALRRRARIILREELATFLADSAPADASTAERPAQVAATPASSASSTSAAIDELRARIHGRLRHELTAQGVEILALEMRDVILPSDVLAFWHSAPTAARAAARDSLERPAAAPPALTRPVETATPAKAAAPIVTAVAPRLAGSTAQVTPYDAAPGQGAQAYVNALQERLGGLAQGWRRLVRPGQSSGREPDVNAPTRALPTPPAYETPVSAGDNEQRPRPAAAARTLSARTLAAMYDAVQEERITDPETIRHVADALGQYEPTADEEDVLPFDTRAAASDLLRHLAQPAQQTGVDATTGAEPVADSRSRESRPDQQTQSRQQPRDDNILRGG